MIKTIKLFSYNGNKYSPWSCWCLVHEQYTSGYSADLEMVISVTKKESHWNLKLIWCPWISVLQKQKKKFQTKTVIADDFFCPSGETI